MERRLVVWMEVSSKGDLRRLGLVGHGRGMERGVRLAVVWLQPEHGGAWAGRVGFKGFDEGCVLEVQ